MKPISELELETTVMACWDEWLRGYFDGHEHAVGANAPVSFPKASLRYQQMGQEQAIHGLGLTVVWVRPGRARMYWDMVEPVVLEGEEPQPATRQQMAFAETTFMFWVRAQVSSGETNSYELAMVGGERLFAILGNSAATKPLSQNGIHRLRPENPVLVAGDGQYVLRLVSCGAILKYPVRSQV